MKTKKRIAYVVSVCVMISCLLGVFSGCGAKETSGESATGSLEKILRNTKFEVFNEDADTANKTFGEIMDDFIEGTYSKADGEYLCTMDFSCNEEIECLKYDKVNPEYDAETEDLICMTLFSSTDNRVYKLSGGQAGNNDENIEHYIFSINKETDEVKFVVNVIVTNGDVEYVFEDGDLALSSLDVKMFGWSNAAEQYFKIMEEIG